MSATSSYAPPVQPLVYGPKGTQLLQPSITATPSVDQVVASISPLPSQQTYAPRPPPGQFLPHYEPIGRLTVPLADDGVMKDNAIYRGSTFAPDSYVKQEVSHGVGPFGVPLKRMVDSAGVGVVTYGKAGDGRDLQAERSIQPISQQMEVEQFAIKWKSPQ